MKSFLAIVLIACTAVMGVVTPCRCLAAAMDVAASPGCCADSAPVVSQPTSCCDETEPAPAGDKASSASLCGCDAHATHAANELPDAVLNGSSVEFQALPFNEVAMIVDVPVLMPRSPERNSLPRACASHVAQCVFLC